MEIPIVLGTFLAVLLILFAAPSTMVVSSTSYPSIFSVVAISVMTVAIATSKFSISIKEKESTGQGSITLAQMTGRSAEIEPGI